MIRRFLFATLAVALLSVNSGDVVAQSDEAHENGTSCISETICVFSSEGLEWCDVFTMCSNEV